MKFFDEKISEVIDANLFLNALLFCNIFFYILVSDFKKRNDIMIYVKVRFTLGSITCFFLQFQIVRCAEIVFPEMCLKTMH